MGLLKSRSLIVNDKHFQLWSPVVVSQSNLQGRVILFHGFRDFD